MLKTCDRVLAPIVWLVAALLALMLFIGPQVVANDDPNAVGSPTYAKQLFADNCGSCHTLSAAGTTGSLGPSLDGLGLPASAVAAQVESGGGTMPALAGELDAAQIDAIADYVASSSSP